MAQGGRAGSSVESTAGEAGEAGAGGNPAASGGVAGRGRGGGAAVDPRAGSAGRGGQEGPPPPAGPLPDLELDALYLRDTTALDVVNIDDACLVQDGCVTGLGERRVVRFGSRMGNVGSAAFVIGTTSTDNPLWTFDSCKQGFDLVGFARYELIDAVTGDLVLAGTKTEFCIADAEQWIVDSDTACNVHNCTLQGISPGCADNYGSSLECQWVDITDIPPGTYDLRVTINAARNVAELDYTNNVVIVRVQIRSDGISSQP